MSGCADSAARRHAYDSSIKQSFDTNSRQNYRIRLQRRTAAFFCNLISRGDFLCSIYCLGIAISVYARRYRDIMKRIGLRVTPVRDPLFQLIGINTAHISFRDGATCRKRCQTIYLARTGVAAPG
jgi:hypothetical protein